ncbi:uncharacterized protein PFL1_05500 [Pseudozyma flocculosa PF-1]|uniref:Related to peroxisomal membrane protein 20 n=2 Tax=Pseudozyma flocculosa TaxID=84751 RepID=A0A5C3FAH9_9BASI|nr:uncharacterized protein PFL1_05500 [Pseudozyma flocculosa PF-1]EPQ26865.1 hypothetical protein PFL1_05500 [Pseudozyma flocculosa PF-1]SPO41230.1 related to peroxisomal membrane protein 20 [Pseudozyma flocculosa]
MSHLTDKLKAAVKGPIKEGDSLPKNILLKESNPEQGTVDLAGQTGRILVVGVPGAFTPPCSSHVPGYVQHADAFNQKGVEGVYVVAVNDAFTTQAWKEKLGASSPHVHILADDTGAFTHAVGLNFDATGLLGGQRSQRYALLVEGGIVKKAFVEKHAPDVSVTSADNVLKAI